VLRETVFRIAATVCVLAAPASAQLSSAPGGTRTVTTRELRLPSGRTVSVYQFVVSVAPADSAVGADGTGLQRVEPARTFNVYYGTTLPATDTLGRQAEAAEVVAVFAPYPPASSAGRLHALLCETAACAELRGPPHQIYAFERAPDGTLRQVPDGRPRQQANEELKLTALASDAAGSLRSPAALLMVRRSLTPAR
jgi:hypothetical protein